MVPDTGTNPAQCLTLCAARVPDDLPMTPHPACRRPAVAALLGLLVWLTVPHPAQAGSWNLAYDFASDLSGWSGYSEPGYLLCGRTATAECPDASTNRIHLRPWLVPAPWAQGRWEWTAPPGTTIVGGELAYRTRMLAGSQFARVKLRADGQDWGTAPAVVSEQQTGPLTDHVVALPAGYRQLGIALYSHPGAVAVTGLWDDYVTLVRLAVTVDDPTPPTLAWSDGGQLLDGAWHRDDVCAAVTASDGQSGVAAVTVQAGSAAARFETAATGSQYRPRPPSAAARLCLAAAALGEGVQSGQVVASDATGGASAPLGFTVRIDRTAPSAVLLQPTAPSPKPQIAVAASDALSGVASASAAIDGEAVPAALVAGKLRLSPALAFGDHSLTWSVSDSAGNVTVGSATVTVSDPTPPVIMIGAPADGAVLAGGLLGSVRVSVTDDGSGLDPAGYAILLDGRELPAGAETASGYTVSPGIHLAAGAHRLEARARDRAGNSAHVSWMVTAPSGSVAAPAAPSPGGATPVPAAGPPGHARAAARLAALTSAIGGFRPRAVRVRFSAPLAAGDVRVATRCGARRHSSTLRPAGGRIVVRIDCAGRAGVRAQQGAARATTTIAPRVLPLLLAATADRERAPAVITVRARAGEIAGRLVAIQALGQTGWRRIGVVRASSRGRLVMRFTARTAGAFALRATIPELAAVPSRSTLVTLR